ncbi:hypothetical protein [Rhizobium sp. ZX09]|uniref:hypothetical protein n=1 Tax=Rhizobium sp. ZX09 TaxID=2291939 RepID=UPI001A997EEE|nr:hypothetical protein [Rhizobium sp. ZX09]
MPDITGYGMSAIPISPAPRHPLEKLSGVSGNIQSVPQASGQEKHFLPGAVQKLQFCDKKTFENR